MILSKDVEAFYYFFLVVGGKFFERVDLFGDGKIAREARTNFFLPKFFIRGSKIGLGGWEELPPPLHDKKKFIPGIIFLVSCRESK